MMDIDAIMQQVRDGWINVQKHPTCDLYIYNYSQQTQFEGHWTPETMACRGLILDGSHRVVARPFPKFFNLDQLEAMGESVPALPFEVFDKLDGSLGILYYGNGWQIATRGSFVSEQAQLAQQMYDAVAWKKVDHSLTLLFEIIHPQNRIVVDYGKRAELVLLSAIRIDDGSELPYEELVDFGFPVAARYDGLTDLAAIRQIQNANAEGFVIRFSNGFRVKVKFEEYKRLHKLLTGVTSRHIWEHLRDGNSVDQLIEKTPDEFHQWVLDVVSGINQNYIAIENECKTVFRRDFATRKDAAAYFTQQKYPSILFSMYDGKPYDSAIWKLVRPHAASAFRCEMETA